MNALHTLAETDRTRASRALVRSHDLRKALQILSFVVLGAAVGALLLVATATVPVLFGYHTYIIKGGSMEPTLKRGSVAIAAPTSPRALRVGDIIAYHHTPENPPVLHRIVEVTNENGQLGFITQGDSNQTPDSEPTTLQGPGDKVVYSVPYAGYVLNFSQSGTGRLALIGVPLAVLLALFLHEGRQSARVRKEPETGLRPVARQTAPAAAVVTPTYQQVTPIRVEAASITPRAAPAPPVASPFKAERSQGDLPAFLVGQLRRRGAFEPMTQAAAASSTGGPVGLRGPPSPEWPQRTTRRVA